MITRDYERWIAKTEYPNCNVVFKAESKDELRSLIIKDFKAHQRIYESRDDDLQDFSIYCMTKLVILLDELDNYPSN